MEWKRLIGKGIEQAQRLNFRRRIDQAKLVLEKLANDSEVPEETRIDHLINYTALTCAIIAAQPLPFADILILTPIQVAMVYFMAKAMKVPLQESGARDILVSVVGVAGWGLLAQHGVIALYKAGLPFLGAISTIPLVYAATFAIGCAARAILEARRQNKKLSADMINTIKKEAFEQAKRSAQNLTVDSMKQQIEDLIRAVNEAEKESQIKDQIIDKLSNRQLRNQEITEYFHKALREAKSEIDIMSPWIRFNVINKLRSDFEAALRRGVKIRILYGISDPSDADGDRNDQTIKAVRDMETWFSRFGDAFKAVHCSSTVNRDGTHGKLLICDDRFYIIGSFNWLSFRGDYRDGGRDELAEYSENPDLLSKYRKDYFSF